MSFEPISQDQNTAKNQFKKRVPIYPNIQGTNITAQRAEIICKKNAIYEKQTKLSGKEK